MIANRTYRLPAASISSPGELVEAVEKIHVGEPLRWFVSHANQEEIVIESTECLAEELPERRGFDPAPFGNGRAVAISIVPTGIGCAVGGYAGDAGPATALLASAADLVVTNPNAVNASNFVALDANVVYTEGYSLDLFAAGLTDLFVPRSNRIGVIIEAAHPDAVAQILNVINVVRAVHGAQIAGHVVTDEPIGTRSTRHGSGAYVGQVDRPDVLLSAGRQLLDAGANAIAVTSNVRGLSRDDYASHFLGGHPNPVGGAEAVISHLVTRALRVPAAHAPMINYTESHAPDWVVDARSAAEFVSTSGLACVLLGLRRAPQLVPRADCPSSTRVSGHDVLAVVAPATALGSVPVLMAAQRGIPVVAVRANSTILDVTAPSLSLPGVIEVEDYLAAAGVLLALRTGISVESVCRPLASLAGAIAERTAAARPMSYAAG